MLNISTNNIVPANTQQSQALSPNAAAAPKANQAIVLTNANKESYKPFISEKQLINTMAWQENQITATFMTFTDLIPQNFKINKEYGERMFINGERLRQQLNVPTPECKDFNHMLLQLGGFFEIIGRLYSQNYNNVKLETEDLWNNANSVVRSHKDLNLSQRALKILPRAQAIHEQAEKFKADFDKTKKETQESLQKVKNSKQDPNLIYNLTEKQALEEKASKAVKELEEKKQKYNQTAEQLELKNKQLVAALEQMSKEHQGLVDYSTTSVKSFLDALVTCEINHYEGLNIIAPEKGQLIKNIIIKQDIVSDINVAEDIQLKIDLNYARTKLQDLPEPASNHSGVQPFCEYVTDTYTFYTKVTDRTGKILSFFTQFLTDLCISDRTLAKQYNQLFVSERKRKENLFGPFQGHVLEFFRIIDEKEKIHTLFSRNMDAIIAKSDQIIKSYRTDEKTFLYSIQKIAKDMASTSEKVAKQTQQQEKQLSKISELLKGNFQGQNEKMTNFQNLMIEYQNITESLRESNSSFKGYVMSQIENLFELVRSFKQSQQTVMKALAGVVQNVLNQEQQLIDSHHKTQKEFKQFIDIVDSANLINQFKCQLLNKQQADLFDSINQQDLESIEQQPPQETDMFEDEQLIGESTPTKIALQESPNNNNPDGVGSSEQLFQFNPSEITERKISADINQRKSLHNPDFEFTVDEEVKESPEHKSGRSKSNKLSLQRSSQHESLLIKDNNPFETKLSQTVNNENSKQDSFEKTEKIAQKHKHSQSVYQRHTIQPESIMNPLKKQFGRLSNLRDDLNLDEQTQREIDQLKQNRNTFQITDDSSESLSKLTENCKFIREKFFGLLDAETCLESYSCAISMKILIQGRLYVTNKRLCFHSYFNDKTIFGKETKIMIPLTNISRVEKKTNVMVFDNSISIFTKEDREIFITSFMFRDQAYDLINQQLGHSSNGGPSDVKDVGQAISNDATGQILPSEEGSSYDQRNEAEAISANEEFIEAQEQIVSVYDNAEIKITPEFKQIEQERIEQMRKTFPEIEKFSFVGFEENIECSLKHVFQAFLNHGTKFPQYENLSIQEWLDKYPLTNIDNVFDKPSIPDAPSYFNLTGEQAPTPDVFKNWPLYSRFTQSMTHLVEKPKMMQPKQNKTIQTVDTFYLSPRMIIRRYQFQLEGVPFADSFNFENKITYEQEESSLPSGHFRTKMKAEFRVNIIKPIRFIQGTVVKETENSLRDTYCQGPYKAHLFKMLLDTREYMKQQWAKQNSGQAQRSPQKASKQKKPIQEEVKGTEPIQQSHQEQHIVPQPYVPQNIPPMHFSQEQNKDLKIVHDELLRMTQLTQKLIYLVGVAVVMNLMMMILFVLK